MSQSILKTLGAFAKIVYMVQHNTIAHMQKVISLPKQTVSKQNPFFI